MEVAALWISIAAAAISLAAAAFTCWQAVEARRTRLDPLKADWVFDCVDLRLRGIDAGWHIRNTGGTTAANVTLTVQWLEPVPDEPKDLVLAAGVVPAGARVRPPEWEQRLPPDGLYEQYATVHWDDEKRKRRSKQIPLY